VFQTLLEYCGSRPRELEHDIRAFRGVQNEVQLECYRVWFHANWGANRDKIPALREQLRFGSEIIGGELTDLSQWID